MNIYRFFTLAAIGLVVFVEPAFAGVASKVPGPIAGIGLPALAIIAGAYWIGRKLLGGKK